MIYGSGTPEDERALVVVFLVQVFPFGILGSLVGHCFDNLTCEFVKDNSFGGNLNQAQGINDNQGLTEHQRELLKIPITAKKVSLFSTLPGIIALAIKFGFGVDDIVRIHLMATLVSLQQTIRIVIILTCLLKANEANQVQLSAEERRQARIDWERTHSFRYQENYKQARQALGLDQPPQPGPSCQPSQARNIQRQTPSHHQERKRQILDPGLLEQIIIDGNNEVPGKKLSTKKAEGTNQGVALQILGPISKNEAQSSSTDQGTRKKIASPARSKGLNSNDKSQTRQGIHQDQQTFTKPGPSRKTQLLDPLLLGQILEDRE